MKKHVYLALFAICCSSVTLAQSQLEMNESSQKNYKVADTELNKLYKVLMGKLDQNEKPLLIASQKDWIKFRDSNCKFEGAMYEGGSMQPMVVTNCLESTTLKRNSEIKAAIQDRSN